MKKSKAANILTAIICIIALFVPTYIAVLAFLSKPEDIPEGEQQTYEMTAVAIKDIDGKEYIYTTEADSIGMLGIIDDILKKSTKVNSLSDAVRATPAYAVTTTTSDGKTAAYRFYFSVKGASYYEDDAGNAYGIPAEYCNAFLATECAVTLFYKTKAPTLRNAYGSIILPNQMSWKYLNFSGGYSDVQTSTTDAIEKYDIDGAFTLYFDIVPDRAKAVVYDGDQEIYSGDLASLSSNIEVERDSTYRIEITASWYEDSSRDFSGEAKYIFNSDVSPRAHFVLGANGVEAGQIAVINGANIKDPSLIEITFTPALKYNNKDIKPVFFGEGGVYSALIPIPADCFADSSVADGKMKFQIDIKYADATTTLNLDVTDRTGIKTENGNATLEQIGTLRTAQNLADFATLLAEAAKKTSSSKLWTETLFFSYEKDGFNYALSFGRNWKLTNGIKYQNESIDFKAKGNYNIVATNSGIVVAAGENEFLGKYVCVDHGMGLQTWYLHLSEIYVEVGDTVDAVSISEYDRNYKTEGWDKAIGRCSPTGTGFVEHTDIAFSVMYTVNGVPVCPYSQNSGVGLEETGLKMDAFNS